MLSGADGFKEGPSSVTTLVLVGGLGARLRPLTGDQPKVLAPVAGRPFLDHVLSYLQGQGVSDVVLCTGYAGESVADYCGSGAQWGERIRFSRENEPLGTGGAIRNAQSLINSDPFLVLNGDSLVQADLAQLVHLHQLRQARISMVLVKVEDQKRFGSVRLGKDDCIVGFDEKGQDGPGLINAGVYAFDRSVLDAIPAGEIVSLEKDIFPRYVGNAFYGITAPGAFIDIGTPDSYIQAQEILAAWSVQ